MVEAADDEVMDMVSSLIRAISARFADLILVPSPSPVLLMLM